jgi:hypothetical protein
MLKLPLDISTFSVLRKEDYLYVDKTRQAYNLITQGRRYFLSRPRRFGKSLFVSMLKELLEGNKYLFKGLWIENSDFTWKQHGVIVLDMSSMGISDVQSFNEGLSHALQKIAENYDFTIILNAHKPELALKDLVAALYKRFGAVAILIDEYDSPLLHAMHDALRAEAIREAMHRFFATIKGLDAYVNFALITAVSSFTKAGLFSGINNLRVITLDTLYAEICGYTQDEVHHYFSDYVKQWASEHDLAQDTLYAEIKKWYNGYSFGVDTLKVYNPFSFMHALHSRQLKNFWFRTGTPKFLVSELSKEFRVQEYRIFDPETFRASEDLLESFDIGATPLPALMFQSGYLTINAYDPTSHLYQLTYPNIEVQQSMQKYLVAVFADIEVATVEKVSSDLEQALRHEDIGQAVLLLKRLFMHIPYQLHVKEEKFYHALLHMVCNAYGMKIVSEQAISHGRIDLIIALQKLLYVIEIKFNDSPEHALKQIEAMRYYEPFIKDFNRIILLGLSFNRTDKHFDIQYAYHALGS